MENMGIGGPTTSSIHGHGTGAAQGIGRHAEDLGLLVCKENKGKQKLRVKEIIGR